MGKRKERNLKPIKKAEIAPGLPVDFEGEIPNFAALYNRWEKKAEQFKIDYTGRTNTNILDWIANIGQKGRAKPDGSTGTAEAPPQEYIDRAKDAGTKDEYSSEQISAIKQLQQYLIENKNSTTSKVNPANIKFNDIRSFDKRGKILSRRDVYGDFRTKQFVKYQARHKKKTFAPADTHYLSRQPGKARPPTWQALFGNTKDVALDFNSPSLLMIATFTLDAFASGKAKGKNTKARPFNLTRVRPSIRGEAAKWAYENISDLKTWFDSKMKDSSYLYRTGNLNDRKLHRDIKERPFKLTDNESKKLLEWVGADVNVDLDKVFINLSRRQLRNMAEIAGFENQKEKEEVKKHDSSDWREIVKAV